MYKDQVQCQFKQLQSWEQKSRSYSLELRLVKWYGNCRYWT